MREAYYFCKSMCGRPGYEGSLDMLRAHLFATTSNDLRYLPPTEDAFKQHVLRAFMQISISKSSHLSNPSYPNPTSLGRVIINGKLAPVLMCKPAKPSVVKHKTVSCNCKQGRCLRRCKCAKFKVSCVSCAISCLCGGSPSQCGRAEKCLPIQDNSSDED